MKNVQMCKEFSWKTTSKVLSDILCPGLSVETDFKGRMSYYKKLCSDFWQGSDSYAIVVFLILCAYLRSFTMGIH